MADHKFGIMQTAPNKGKRYDDYEPQKYNCISVNDDYLEDIAASLSDIDFYRHTLDISGKGIAYCGITLIPPTSIPEIISVIDSIFELTELKELLNKAYIEDKWVIHFGI